VTAAAKAKSSEKDRVQGTSSRLGELVLHNGKKLALEIGGGITPTPSLTRTIEGSSSITLGLYDPDLSFLPTSLLAEQWDAKIDGLWFRYVSTSKTGKNLSLTLEDRHVAKLRNFTGPEKKLRAQYTRAEFVKWLVETAAPDLDFFCPQLHVKQPIETKAKAEKAKADAKTNRGKGIGDAKHLTVGGAAASPSQIELGETAGQIAESASAPFIVRVALFAALMDESSMGASAAGNVLQGLGSGGAPIGNAEEEISGFLTGKPTWTGTAAIQYHKESPGKTFYEIAQAVQASGAGEASNGAANYGKFGDEARAWVEAFSGEAGEDVGSATVTEPYRFEVGKKETYWDAIQRLAKQVNWRAFISAGRFYFMPEPELLQGMVRLAITPELVDDPDSGIENVDFDFHVNKLVTEVKVTAIAHQWKPPPGSVVTIAGYGPASIGFGDAPIKKNSQGQKMGLSQNVNTRTGEGRGRYLVSSIEAPLTESSDARLVTITLKKATAPLPEPAATTKSAPVTGTSSAAAGAIKGEMGALEGTAEDVVNEVVFYAQKNGFPGISPGTVKAANATHGPTVDGGRSDHQGPPETAWAADISNGYKTPEEAALAAAIAKAFGIPWDGAGLVTHETGGYRLQLIHNTYEGGDHFDHVHFGCEVI
jgi:hypothetical protein